VANLLTHLGQKYALGGNGSGDGSIARLATAIKLFTDASTPNQDGSGFTEVANGNGYTTGGKSIQLSDWAILEPSTDPVSDTQIKLETSGGGGGDLKWTASGGTIDDIKGAYIVDTNGDVLAWWERPAALTLQDGDEIDVADLIISG